ncbi:hypothetical protein Avbf_18819 [Armadillidium vulgare]|nr:hypothetical protein Avbf_18819 [Armadillidium vulgare]
MANEHIFKRGRASVFPKAKNTMALTKQNCKKVYLKKKLYANSWRRSLLVSLHQRTGGVKKPHRYSSRYRGSS